MADLSIAHRLALLAYQMLFRRKFKNTDTDEFARVADAVQHIWDAADPPLRRRLQRVTRDVTDPVEKNDGALRDLLLWLLAVDELQQLAGSDVIDPSSVPERVELAAARRAVGHCSSADERSIVKWLDDKTGIASTPPNKEGTAMSSPEVYIDDRYVIDDRNLPETFNKAAFGRAIRRRFEDRDLDISEEPTGAHAAYVAGSLLRGSYFDPKSPGFDEEFQDVFNRGYDRAETVDRDTRVLHRDVYAAVAEEVRSLKGDEPPTVQEVAGVSDDVLDRGPVDDNFTAKVRNAHDDFVSRTPVYDSLVLPDVITDETAEAEVEPVNIRAVAMVYATNKLELAQLLTAVDTAAQDWSDGVLPVGDNAGRLFDEYVWNAHDRLDPAARQIQYERISELDGYVLRFCSATSEFDRSRYLSEYLRPDSNGRRRSPQPRDAAVRKTARDLLAYASLHGWAYTQFAAKRMANQIRQCVDIIENAEVQKAYSAQGPWQVVERVSAMTTGRTPDIAKQRALASTGKEIVDTLAGKAIDIAASLARYPLFPPEEDTTVSSTSAAGGNGRTRSVFSAKEYDQLLNLVENWLAANAVTDSTRFDAAQPREVATSPSIPSFNGSSNGFGGFDSEVVKNQLMQMVSAGQMPTADQVNQLFGVGR